MACNSTGPNHKSATAGAHFMNLQTGVADAWHVCSAERGPSFFLYLGHAERTPRTETGRSAASQRWRRDAPVDPSAFAVGVLPRHKKKETDKKKDPHSGRAQDTPRPIPVRAAASRRLGVVHLARMRTSHAAIKLWTASLMADIVATYIVMACVAMACSVMA